MYPNDDVTGKQISHGEEFGLRLVFMWTMANHHENSLHVTSSTNPSAALQYYRSLYQIW